MTAMATSVAAVGSTSCVLRSGASASSSCRSEVPGTALSSCGFFRQGMVMPSERLSGGQLQWTCNNWRQVNATYAGFTNTPDYNPTSSDVTSSTRPQKILVLGGSGFVGTEVCKAAILQGISVVSLSRSGRPSSSAPWADRVTWVAGDVFLTDWDSLLGGVEAVVSTLGMFGPNDQMERINAEANILALTAAKKAGVQKFVYISVHDYNLPEFALNNGYFAAKRKTEQEVLTVFPTSGIVLRPGIIFGTKKVYGIDIPLHLLGEPLEKLLEATSTLTRPLKNLPASDLLLAPPTRVEDVAAAVIRALIYDYYNGIFSIEQIKDMAKE
ncbi:uncharacterized protein At1g32220, chloroplastic [Physcomitrium patens]|uniref:NAD(P)-binding domain-containing protein n=1 Tax=Physcomitrium patens TaxID=3218 RepID=A0A2K1IJK8_PHYPA|nr:uncharacterized protein At1g32220, chloroplastic-like [Physcomitrium patens]PNR29464.1 hypothetical protein PHYPA_028157 [Physcomitrium patens]|eukprot:XP_024363118.1 uncharacterized protein At1g32220, chloroplastic-like [Physcomitrella patens]